MISRIKKLVPFALASMLVFGVTACEWETEEAGEEQIEQTETEQTGEAAFGEEQAEPESEMNIEQEAEFGEEESDVGYGTEAEGQSESGGHMESGGHESEQMNE